MSKKKSLSRLSSSATFSADLSSRSFVFSSFRSEATDNGYDASPDGHDQMGWGDDPEKGQRQKSRPLSSFANTRLSHEGPDDEGHEVENDRRVKKTTSHDGGSSSRSATSKLMETISWRRCLLAITFLGILSVTIYFSLQKSKANGKEKDVQSFVSSNGTTSNNNDNSNIFDAGQGVYPQINNTVQSLPTGYQDTAPSLTPSLYFAEGSSEGTNGVQANSPAELQTTSPRMETNSPSSTTTGRNEPPPLSISPPASSPTVVTNPPSTSSTPSTVYANALVSSPSLTILPPLDLPVSFTISAPSIDVDVTPVVLLAPTVPAPTIPAPTVPAPTVPAPIVPAPIVPAPTIPSPTPPIVLGSESVILYSNEAMGTDVFRFSPNGAYQVGLTLDGDLVVVHQPFNELVWSSGTAGRGIVQLSMQPDGNLLLRDGSGVTIWATNTYGYPGARLVVDDGGQVAVKTDTNPPTTLWLHGVPRGGGISYTSDYNRELVFPVRGAFYYP
jgi:hypothetical protein